MRTVWFCVSEFCLLSLLDAGSIENIWLKAFVRAFLLAGFYFALEAWLGSKER